MREDWEEGGYSSLFVKWQGHWNSEIEILTTKRIVMICLVFLHEVWFPFDWILFGCIESFESPFLSNWCGPLNDMIKRDEVSEYEVMMLNDDWNWWNMNPNWCGTTWFLLWIITIEYSRWFKSLASNERRYFILSLPFTFQTSVLLVWCFSEYYYWIVVCSLVTWITN